MPTEPTFANQRLAPPPAVRQETRPRSIVRRRPPSSATRTASSNRAGIPCVRPKSCPVPGGEHGDLASSVPATPLLTTSLSVPSPPTTTSSVSGGASRAASARWPGRWETTASPTSPSSAARCASFGQRLPVEPFALAGLTRKRTFPGSRFWGITGARPSPAAVNQLRRLPRPARAASSGRPRRAAPRR